MLRLLLVDVCEQPRFDGRRKKGEHPRRAAAGVDRGDRGGGPSRAPPGSASDEHEERTRSQRCDHDVVWATILTRLLDRSVQKADRAALFL